MADFTRKKSFLAPNNHHLRQNGGDGPSGGAGRAMDCFFSVGTPVAFLLSLGKNFGTPPRAVSIDLD